MLNLGRRDTADPSGTAIVAVNLEPPQLTFFCRWRFFDDAGKNTGTTRGLTRKTFKIVGMALELH
jgi:hypothetical protein